MKDKGAVFPEEKRRSNRSLRVILRTLHIISFSVLFGGHWFEVPLPELLPWLYGSAFTGAGLMAYEAWAGPAWLAQLAGGFTLIKLALLCLVPVFPDYAPFLLLLVVAIASVGSHMPGFLRHYNYLERSPGQ